MRERPEWRKPESGIGMDYRSEGFAVRARKLIAHGERMTFDIVGKDFGALQIYLGAGQTDFDWSRAVVSPLLQPLCAVIALAEAHDMHWRFTVTGDAAHFEVGPRVS